jgi:hypothetical protein
MNFIHAVKTLPGLVDDALGARLRVMPAVVLTGRMVEWLTPEVLALPWWRVL